MLANIKKIVKRGKMVDLEVLANFCNLRLYTQSIGSFWNKRNKNKGILKDKIIENPNNKWSNKSSLNKCNNKLKLN
jgi:hypothetical protein